MRYVKTLWITVLLCAFGFDAVAAEYAVVSQKTWFHQSPASDSEKFRVGGDYWITVEKLDDRKGWTKVRFNHIASDRRCYPPVWKLSTYRLDAWVRDRALETVTREVVTSKFEDGTSVKLNAGVVVTSRKKKGWYTAHLAGYRWPARMKPGHVGKTFRAKKTFSHPDGNYAIAEENFIVGGEPIIGSKGEGFRIRREVEIDGTLRRRLGRKCITAMVLGDFREPAKGAGGMGILGALTSRGDGEAYWVAPRGTAIFWDGEPVGETIRKKSIWDSKTIGDKICFSEGKRLESGPIQLCAARKHLREETYEPLMKSLEGLGSAKVDSGPLSKTMKPKLSEAVARRVIRQRTKQARACYDDEVEHAAPGEVRPEIVVKFAVDEKGEVVRSRVVSSTLKNDEVTTCLLDVVDGMIFPAREGREVTEFEHPFAFGPE